MSEDASGSYDAVGEAMPEGAALGGPYPVMPAPTEAEIRLVAQHADDYYVQALIQGWGDIEAAGINTPLRWTHFLAQCLHETGGLTIVRENTGWSPQRMAELWPNRFQRMDPRILLAKGDPEKLANLAYSDRAELGNLGGSDGWDYRGGGFLQLTGRGAYHDAGNAIGYDLEGNPELIEDPHVSLRAALWVWTKHRCGEFADHNYGRTVSNAINRGNPYSKKDPIGARSREQWFRRTWAVFNAGQQLPQESELHLGAYGPVVSRVQGQLKALGYQIGASDGVYGPTMARAVAGFKSDQRRGVGVELEPGDTIGSLTLAALDTAEPISLSPERRNISMQGLLAEGSTEMRAGQHMQHVGTGLTLTGLGLGLNEVGALDSTARLMQQVSLLKVTAVPFIGAVQWGLKNLFWVAVIGGGVYCWRSGAYIKFARWTAHRLGLNLSR